MRLGLVTSLLAATAAALVDKGRVVELGGISYYVGGISVGQIGGNCTRKAVTAKAQISGHDLFPLTIIESSSDTLAPAELLNITGQYDVDDDVFQPAFLRTIWLQSSDDSKPPAVDAEALEEHLEGLDVALFITGGKIEGASDLVAPGAASSGLPKGPYFVSAASGLIYKAHRLYDDDYLAFIQGVVSDEEGGYISLPAVTENVMAKSIAVPSRLYYTVTEKQPLAGLRVGVKDIFHIKGVGTSGGNRAYFYHYGTQNKTGPAVQRLIDLGAVVVGKTGTVQFANGDRPTGDWVDVHAPFNPRGDGYQNPSGSSSGSGAAIAAYEWLDLTVGSDTGGSMRGPAGSQGVYGNRPSTGAISLDEVLPLSPVSDTAGLFARSGALWARATQAWYSENADIHSNFTSYPKTLWRSKAMPNATPEAADLLDEFTEKLAGFLGTEQTLTNYTELWAMTHAPGAPANLSDMFYLTYAVFISHDQWRLLGKPFFEDYAVQNGGRRPYVNPGPLSRWVWGQANATDEIYSQALRNISTFTEWYETEGYGRPSPESCSEGLYIYPWSTGSPSYRDTYFSAPTQPPMGFEDGRISVMAGVPEVVVPVGEVPYMSTKSLQTEYLPVTMTLRMARGCDHVLASLVSDLEEAGILRPVLTGRNLYT
jgi:hypothetical protein